MVGSTIIAPQKITHRDSVAAAACHKVIFPILTYGKMLYAIPKKASQKIATTQANGNHSRLLAPCSKDWIERLVSRNKITVASGTGESQRICGQANHLCMISELKYGVAAETNAIPNPVSHKLVLAHRNDCC